MKDVNITLTEDQLKLVQKLVDTTINNYLRLDQKDQAVNKWIRLKAKLLSKEN